MAIVGLAAGTTAHEATAVFGPIPIDGFEIDPAIIAVGRKYFDMNSPNLTAIACRRKIPLALVNARLSPRSEGRFRKFNFFVRPYFRNLDLIAVLKTRE